MAVGAITLWLGTANPHYETGVLLYDQYGSSILLKTFFKGGKGEYHLARLKESLTKLNLEACEQPLKPTTLIIPQVEKLPVLEKRIHSLSDSEWDAAPEKLKDLYAENHRLKSHAELLHHQIRIEPDRGKRLMMALQLLNERDEANGNWRKIKAYQETGELQKEVTEASSKAIAEMSANELLAIVRNYPTYISKDKKRLAVMVEGPKKEKKFQLVKLRELELEDAKKRLEKI